MHYHLHFEDRSIYRREGMDDHAVVVALQAGSRVVIYEMVCTAVTISFVSKQRLLVRPGESWWRVAGLATVLTGLFGWWGFAILATPGALYRNLRGGTDVTADVLAELTRRIAAAEVKEARDRDEQAAAVASSAPPEARRERALELIDRGDVDRAWQVLGDDLLRRRPPLCHDGDLLRRLVLRLHDKRAWERAARVATLLRDQEVAVTGYLGNVLDEIARRADKPDGFRDPPALWERVLVPVCLVAAIVGTIVVCVVARVDERLPHH